MGDKGTATEQESAAEAWQRVQKSERDLLEKEEAYFVAESAYELAEEAYDRAWCNYHRILKNSGRVEDAQ